MTPAFQLRECAKLIRQGGVITYPTESVYGLGCDPLCESAVHKILLLKQRPVQKGLIVIASRIEQLAPYINISEQEQHTICNSREIITWLVDKSDFTPPWVSGEHPKIAIRLSQHPVARQICEQLGHPVISTSANPSAAPAAKNLLQVRQYFSNSLDYYISGDTGTVKQATPIRDLKTGKSIRL